MILETIIFIAVMGLAVLGLVGLFFLVLRK
jgi:hypothetical protein